MANVSYDQTKRLRSAAGTARTTPGISGTTSNPNGGAGAFPSAPPQQRYNAAKAAGAPQNSTPQLSKAAGGKGAGTPNQQPWLLRKQNSFNRGIEHRQRRDRQRTQSTQQGTDFMQGRMHQNLQAEISRMNANPNYVPSMQQYQYVRVPGVNPTTPSMQPQLNQLEELAQMNMNMQQNPDAFSQWLQNQYGQGLLNGVAESDYKYRNDQRLQQMFG